MHQLTCSIVLYRNDISVLCKTIESVLQTNLAIKLYLIDNSPNDDLKKIADTKSIEYIFNDRNLGFGKAHNIALNKAIEFSPYHIVLNPDIEFENGVLEDIFRFMQKHNAIGQLMPKVFYDNGDLQKLCHLLPTPADLIGRRFFQQSSITKKLNDRYELKDFDYTNSANIPNLSGCFMFLRTAALRRIGNFDARFFMYMEDVDLTRRMHRMCETLFYPHVNITHKFEKESYTNPVLMRHHINSAIKYFNKWGWWFDSERKKINETTLHRLNIKEDRNIPVPKLEKS
jgi:GT2 family glycosyltransferase